MTLNILRAFTCVGLAAAVLFTGCKSGSMFTPKPDNTLYVGVTPDYAPIVFKQNNQITGLEVDFARELGLALKRPVEFVPVKWNDQIEALLTDQVDIIMSGMTITNPRKIRIAFSDPYLKEGLTCLIRRNDLQRYTKPEAIINENINFGVQQGSTADVFVNQRCKNAISITYIDPRDAQFNLVNRKIDVFIHDSPAVLWLASESEADLAVVPPPMTEEYLAWGLRKDDSELLQTVNENLKRWKQDGTYQRILKRWLPAL